MKSLCYIKSIVIPNKILDNFEDRLDFFSFRKVIEREERRLLLQGVDPDSIFIDNHFVASNFIRTFLNTLMELKVGNSIFKYFDDKTLVEITDGNFVTLQEIREIDNPRKFFRENVVIHNLKEPPVCSAFFTAIPVGQRTISFLNGSSSSYPPIAYSWNFGDILSGTNNTSSLKNPTHEFTSDGTFTVILNITDNIQCTSQKTLVLEIGGCTANFTVNKNNEVVTFTNTSIEGISAKYLWDFGDGSAKSTDMNPTHTYSKGGIYKVCLTVTNPFGCFDEYCEEIQVFITGDCFDRNDRNKDKSLQYSCDGTQHRVKGIVSMSNFLGHRITAKTKNYKKTKVLGWIQSKADRIFADVEGQYWNFDNDDNCQTEKTESGPSANAYGKSEVHYEVKVGENFGVKDKALESTHFVECGGSTFNAPNLFLTTDCPKTCIK